MKVTAISPNIAFLRQRAIEGIVMRNPFQPTLSDVVRAPKNAPPLHLTTRQLEVLSLLCEGLSNKLIARRLNISGATVKVHIGNILRELGVSSRLQAVVAARRLELVADPSIPSSRQLGTVAA